MRRVLLFAVVCMALSGADPDMVINNSTGSDTAASGAPSTFGPFSAVATCTTGGVATTVITWAANPLAGVPTDGSALLWMATASGRRWSKITARAAGTVTVEDTFNIPGGTPVDCAVGGKRASISATRTLVDAKAGWFYSIEATGSDYNHTASVLGWIPAGSNRRITVRGSGGRPRLVWTADVEAFSTSGADTWSKGYFEGIDFANTAGTKVNARFLNGTNQIDNTTVRDCTFDGFRNVGPNTGGDRGLWYNNEVENGAVGGIIVSNATYFLIGNYVHNNTGAGIGEGSSADRVYLLYNISAANSTIGFSGDPAGAWLHNLAYDNGGDGFDFGSTLQFLVMAGNLSAENTGFGLDSPVQNTFSRTVDNNAYWNNTAGNYSANAPQGANDSIADPSFVAAGSANWGLGTSLLNRGWPPFTLAAGISSTTFTGVEPGPAQRLGGAGNYAY